MRLGFLTIYIACILEKINRMPANGLTDKLPEGLERARVLDVMDRRRSNRYDLKAPVEFSWTDLEGSAHCEEGHTRDISEFGIFVLTDSRPAPGTQVSFKVSFPSETTKLVRIQASGPVVRVESRTESQGQSGFAAATSETRVFGEELQLPLRRPEEG